MSKQNKKNENKIIKISIFMLQNIYSLILLLFINVVTSFSEIVTCD